MMEKKNIFINGDVRLPLKVGSRAVIDQKSEAICTSTVTAIHMINDTTLIFETKNSIYHVSRMTTAAISALSKRLYNHA